MRARRLVVFVFVLGCSSGESSNGAPDVASIDDTLTLDTSMSFDTTPGDVAPPPVDTGGTGSDAAAEAVEVSSSFGCVSTTPLAPGVTNQSIDVDGAKRTYVLSIPTGYDGKTPLPLVFGWHGRGSTGTAFRDLAGLETVAGNKAIFVYPDASSTGWALTFGGPDQKLYDLLAVDLSGRLCVDMNRFWSFGHDLGGSMASFLGCARGGKTVHAIASISGGPPGTPTCLPSPAFVAHAEDDSVVTFADGQKSRDLWLKMDGCGKTSAPVDPSPCVAYASCGENPVVWCDAPSGMHEWPAFAASGIWSFFSRL